MKNMLKTKPFTLIELMVVVGIIGMLMGMLFPATARVKEKAKYTRWFAFNASLNHDHDTVLNYNFQYPDFKINYDGQDFYALYNSAIGCSAERFEPREYNALLNGAPRFLRGAGRWKSSYSLLFNGLDDYAIVPGIDALDFTEDSIFTIAAWVNFNNLDGIQTIFSKSLWKSVSQYDAYYFNNTISSDVGQTTSSANVVLKPKTWHHIALVNDGKKHVLYLDGKAVESVANTVAMSDGFDSYSSSVKASIKDTSQASINSNKPAAAPGKPDNPGNPDPPGKPDKPGTSDSTLKKNECNFLIGAVYTEAGGKPPSKPGNSKGIGKAWGRYKDLNIKLDYFFAGRMDEVLVFQRDLSPSEIRNIYLMGNPY